MVTNCLVCIYQGPLLCDTESLNCACLHRLFLSAPSTLSMEQEPVVWQKEEMIYLAVLEWVKNSWVQFFTHFLSKETFIPYIYIYISYY